SGLLPQINKKIRNLITVSRNSKTLLKLTVLIIIRNFYLRKRNGKNPSCSLRLGDVANAIATQDHYQ
ncbi:MAG TPA: hypothetical protein VF421_06935, partial [Niabella sp.]